jgi:hypothetical protein
MEEHIGASTVDLQANVVPGPWGTKLTKERFEAGGVKVTDEPEHTNALTDQGESESTFGANARSKAFFEKAISVSWQKSTQGIFDTGNYLRQAREELDRDVYKALKLPFGERTRDRLIVIACHPNLQTHVSELPPHWGTLYALTEVGENIFKAALADGRIHPGLQRAEVRSQVQRLPPKQRNLQNAEIDAPVDLSPTQLRCQIEKLGQSRFRQEVLPPDWVQSQTNTALSLADPEKLIATLERQIPTSNKAARKALRDLKRALQK